jgi:hypothetical protein
MARRRAAVRLSSGRSVGALALRSRCAQGGPLTDATLRTNAIVPKPNNLLLMI